MTEPLLMRSIKEIVWVSSGVSGPSVAIGSPLTVMIICSPAPARLINVAERSRSSRIPMLRTQFRVAETVSIVYAGVHNTIGARAPR